MLLVTPSDERGEFVLPELAALYVRSVCAVTDRVQHHLKTCGITLHKPGTGTGGKRAVIEVGFHSLRHTLVSLCRESNAPLAVVESIVGHMRCPKCNSERVMAPANIFVLFVMHHLWLAQFRNPKKTAGTANATYALKTSDVRVTRIKPNHARKRQGSKNLPKGLKSQFSQSLNRAKSGGR